MYRSQSPSMSSWASAGIGNRGGGTCSLWKCRKMFLCISSNSKTLSRRIMYAFFTTSRRLLGIRPILPLGLHLWTSRGDFVPRPLLCPPLVKIPRAPMTVTTNAIIYHVISLQQLDNETELITLKRAEEWPQYATQQWSNMQFVDREKWPIKRQTDYCTTTNNEGATGIIAH